MEQKKNFNREQTQDRRNMVCKREHIPEDVLHELVEKFNKELKLSGSVGFPWLLSAEFSTTEKLLTT